MTPTHPAPAKLSREKLFSEVVALQRRVNSLSELAASLGVRLPLEWRDEFNEVSETVQLGHLFTSNNGVDFREGELAVAQLRGQISKLEAQAKEVAKH